HRGAQDCAPENTLEAITAAYQQGLNWIEVDIQLTADHQWVVFHDDTLSRATDNAHTAYLAECTLAELRALRIFRDYRIPTLGEVLSVVWAHKGVINLEVKIDPIVESWLPLYFEKTKELLSAWPLNQQRPLISSFHHGILHQLHDAVPGQPLGFLMEGVDRDVAQWATRYAERTSINFQHNKANDNDLDFLRGLNVSRFAYTVNEWARAQHLFNFGVSGVFTDIPCTLLKQNGLE
ncbi:MAG: glycerophosphodiester phosphodiesterase family protein, partial [Pseudomonadota bacterium]